MACRPLSYGEGFLRGVLDFVDCQAQNIGAEGYQALAAPGSTLSILLTALLTILVALYGYRMMFGYTPSARDGVLLLAKIGIVLALVTSWPAYRALVYDLALHGPAQLAGDVGEPAQLPGAGGGLVARLQGVDYGLLALGQLGVGKAATGQKIQRERVVNGQREIVVEDAQQGPDTFEPMALGFSRIFFLVCTISALAAVRLVSGVLIALGPLFIAFLLFDATRGLFEGWVRALAGAALGAVAVTLLLGAQLALIEPWLSYLIAMRQADLTIVGAPVELLVVMAVFGLALLASLYAAARVAIGFRLPAAWREAPQRLASALRNDGQPAQRLAYAGPIVPAEQRNRAAAVADAVAATERREARATGGGGASRTVFQSVTRESVPPAPAPAERSQGRRARARATGSAARRDGRP